jgi:hypothetical protein
MLKAIYYNIIMEYNIENIKEKVYLEYLNNLSTGSNKLSIDTQILNKKISTLNKISNKIKVLNTVSEINTDTDILSENIDYLYLKPWSKLNQIHKIIKIKEYINSLTDCNLKEKEILIDKLIDLIKIKSKLKLKYDDTKGKIISISVLCYSNNKYYIE